MLTQELVRSIFDYQNGLLIRKIGKILKHKPVGYVSQSGYLKVRIGKKQYPAHRLVFLMHHGFLPEIIDHIDGNKLNNKIENLRPATCAENIANQKLRSTNKSGTKGVYWDKLNKKWNISLTKNYKKIYIGSFSDKELAELVAIEAANLYHGNFSAFKGTQNATVR